MVNGLIDYEELSSVIDDLADVNEKDLEKESKEKDSKKKGKKKSLSDSSANGEFEDSVGDLPKAKKGNKKEYEE